jgi:transposase
MKASMFAAPRKRKINLKILMNMMMSKSTEFAALIGIDWASQRHALCLYDYASGKREASTLEHTPEAIAQWAQGLEQRFGGKKIALCLEQTKGPLIYALLEYPFFVLYPINPATAARYRQAFKTSRAKNDPADAQVCLELLLHHRDKLTPWLANDGTTRELSRLLEARRSLIDLRTLLTNMLRDALKSYYPQALELAGQDLFAPLGCQFLLKWPSLEQLQKARTESVRKFYYAHNCRRINVIEKRLHAIGQMKPLCRDRALIEPALIQVKMLARQLLQLGMALKEYDSRIEHRFTQHQDASIWRSFPGAGPTLAPRLCCAFGSERSRYQSALAIQQYSGIAPVQEKSGKNQHWIHRRWAGPTLSTRASLNTPSNRCSTATGPKRLSRTSSIVAKLIPPRCVLWPSNGNASCLCAGAIASLTMKLPTFKVSNNEAHISPTNSTRSYSKPHETSTNNFYQNP